MLPYHGWLSRRDREEKRLTIPWRTDKEDAQAQLARVREMERNGELEPIP